MSTVSLDCPRCGGPATDQPIDPAALILCSWCGARFERLGAEQALRALKNEVGAWLQQTTGASATADTAASIDVATRSFLFNDRILPGIRRDVRRELDEEIGDVLGSPIVVPPLLRRLPGFQGEEAVLVSQRERILGLRSLRARLEAPEVAAFATSAADRLALNRLELEIDRAMLASHAACALAGSGIAHGAELVRNNLAKLRDGAKQSALETATDPGGAVWSRAVEIRCDAILAALDALLATPADLDSLDACASRLEETAQWLLTTETRDLRAALASTGVFRDATALRIIAALAREAAQFSMPALQLVEAMQSLAPWLEGVTHADDAVALVRHWARRIAASCRNATVPAVTDTSWGRVAVEAARQGDERPGQIDVTLAPFWVMPARHAKAEGFLFVSGKQVDGIALVAASSAQDTVLLLGAQEPMAALVQQALAAPSRAPWPVDPPCAGPVAARRIARKVMREQDLKNVSLGETSLVYLPLGVVQLEGSRGKRVAVVGPRGALPYDTGELASRASAIQAVVDTIGNVSG